MNTKPPTGPILYCGDAHGGVGGSFQYLIEAAGQTKASAVVLLGDMEPQRPLQDEMARLTKRGVAWYFIGGNHDADSDVLAERVWNDTTAPHNVHCRVVTLPSGLRLSGVSGVFREAVWFPSSSAAREGAPAFRSRAEHARATPRQNRWKGGPHRKHLGTIYPDEVDKLADMRTDVLICHEAPGYHPNGFDILDTLAQSMHARVLVHGHHHDRIDSAAEWPRQGFASVGLGLRGISAISIDDAGAVHVEVVRKGELDEARNYRQRYLDAFGGDR